MIIFIILQTCCAEEFGVYAYNNMTGMEKIAHNFYNWSRESVSGKYGDFTLYANFTEYLKAALIEDGELTGSFEQSKQISDNLAATYFLTTSPIVFMYMMIPIWLGVWIMMKLFKCCCKATDEPTCTCGCWRNGPRRGWIVCSKTCFLFNAVFLIVCLFELVITMYSLITAYTKADAKIPELRTWIDESLVGLKNISKVYEPIKDIITNYEKTFALGIASYSTTFGTSLLEQLGDTKLAPILADLTTLMDNLKDETERDKLTSALTTAISPLINKAKQLNTTWAEYAKNVTDYQTDHITFNTSYVSGLSPIVDEIISKYAEDTKTVSQLNTHLQTISRWDSPAEAEIDTMKTALGDLKTQLDALNTSIATVCADIDAQTALLAPLPDRAADVLDTVTNMFDHEVSIIGTFRDFVVDMFLGRFGVFLSENRNWYVGTIGVIAFFLAFEILLIALMSLVIAFCTPSCQWCCCAYGDESPWNSTVRESNLVRPKKSQLRKGVLGDQGDGKASLLENQEELPVDADEVHDGQAREMVETNQPSPNLDLSASQDSSVAPQPRPVQPARQIPTRRPVAPNMPLDLPPIHRHLCVCHCSKCLCFDAKCFPHMPCSICSMRAFLSSALIFLLIWTTLFGAFLLVLAAQAAPLKDVQSFIYGGPLEGFLEMEEVTKFFDRVFGNVESGKVKKLNCAANAATMLAEGLASSDLHSAFAPLESQPTLTPSLLAPNLPSLIRNFSIVYNIQPSSKLPAQVVGWYWHWKDVATDSPLVSALSTGLDKQGAFVQKLKKEGGQNVLLYDLTKAGVSDTFSSAVETLVKKSSTEASNEKQIMKRSFGPSLSEAFFKALDPIMLQLPNTAAVGWVMAVFVLLFTLVCVVMLSCGRIWWIEYLRVWEGDKALYVAERGGCDCGRCRRRDLVSGIGRERRHLQESGIVLSTGDIEEPEMELDNVGFTGDEKEESTSQD